VCIEGIEGVIVFALDRTVVVVGVERSAFPSTILLNDAQPMFPAASSIEEFGLQVMVEIRVH
jgi:hypothetical protein